MWNWQKKMLIKKNWLVKLKPSKKQLESAGLNKKYNDSWVIFEPHTYSRVYNHSLDFAKSLLKFDNIIIADIYAAREENIWGVSSEDIVREITLLGAKAIHISDYEDIKTYLSNNVKENDLIVLEENMKKLEYL